MKNNKLKINTEKVNAYGIYYAHFNLKDIEDAIESFITSNENFTKDQCVFSVDTSRGYYDSIDTEIMIYAQREETDEEFSLRKTREAKDRKIAKEVEEKRINKLAEDKEIFEKFEYERLKKKFGGSL